MLDKIGNSFILSSQSFPIILSPKSSGVSNPQYMPYSYKRLCEGLLNGTIVE